MQYWLNIVSDCEISWRPGLKKVQFGDRHVHIVEHRQPMASLGHWATLSDSSFRTKQVHFPATHMLFVAVN